MPLCNAVYQVLYEGDTCTQALQQLLERERPDEEMCLPNFSKKYN